ncbi:MAG: glycogen/starch synthase, partial [Candidatus Omnitrophica bacterium]|nr:glycogen/starch synthase [Candidatus Omnitrophota bacterium]
MKILFVSSEVVPFAKTGGLADVAGSLPIFLEKSGVEIKIAMPKYKTIKVKGDRATLGKGVEVLFIENDKFFNREQLYGDKFGDYPDNLERFSYFSRQCLELIKKIGFKPDVIHCNDWQSSLIPVYLKTQYKTDPFYSNIKTMLTIHNLSYQGLFDASQFQKTGLDAGLFGMDGLEFYGKVNILKGGILFSDIITTVSPTYSREIQTKEFGYGLEGVLKSRANRIYGILNGIDYNLWNPKMDRHIAKMYDAAHIDDKGANKENLQKESALTVNRDIPLIGLISRLADQKGLDLISAVIGDLLKTKIQFICLGTGDEKYHILFERIAKLYPKKASINLKFDAVLAQKIYAGSDMFLMPSRFEPCGLGQMIALRYGTIPIVRLTGGLKDTIQEYDPATGEGNGFAFSGYSSDELL